MQQTAKQSVVRRYIRSAGYSVTISAITTIMTMGLASLWMPVGWPLFWSMLLVFVVLALLASTMSGITQMFEQPRAAIRIPIATGWCLVMVGFALVIGSSYANVSFPGFSPALLELCAQGGMAIGYSMGAANTMEGVRWLGHFLPSGGSSRRLSEWR